MVDFGPDILDTEVPEVEPLDVDISSEQQHELTMALSSGATKSSSPVIFDFSLQSRVEVILNAIINDLVYGEHPKSIVEQILLYILGEVNELPTPHSRVEELLIDLALELESTDISPKSRVEQILLVLLNQPYEFPITHSRVEELLVQLQKHVSEVTGPLPLTISTDGTALIDYRIYGNTEQTGTPTPENPIMPEGVGERTENWFNGNGAYSRISENSTVEFQSGTLVVSNGYGVYFDIDITTNTNYSIKVNPQDSTNYLAFTAVLLPSNTRVIGYHNTLVSARFNSGSNNKIQMVFYSGSSASSKGYSVYSDIMLTKSSTPPTSYIPYGYKLPLTSAEQNVDIYLGESQTTRRIKKLVLTGEENCYKYVYAGTNGIEVTNVLDGNYTRNNGYCSHYPVYPKNISGNFSLWIGVNSKSLFFIGILDILGISSVSDFKSYLAAQYAAGTPVTVWYILKEPETGIVNEPLMKIGDYTDTVSMEQAGVSIPTIAGTTVIDYDGTPKPSQMYVKYNES